MDLIDKRHLIAKRCGALAVLLLSVGNAPAQDPLQTLPKNYKLQFENDWVKITRVHYGPREKLPAHQHTQTASAYVYLNDSGPVVFNHIGLAYGAVTRPATKAGSFRLFRGLKEIHEVENLSDRSSEFLRVEFKTEPLNDKTLRGRYYREDYAAGENFQKVQFENEQVRISRLVCAAGKRLDVSTDSAHPAVLIALTPSRITVHDAEGEPRRLDIEPGQTTWVPVGRQEVFENTGKATTEMLRFDFKSRPLSKEELEKGKEHQHTGS